MCVFFSSFSFILQAACEANTISVHCDKRIPNECQIKDVLSIHGITTLNFIDSDSPSNVVALNFAPKSNITVMPGGIFQHFQLLEEIQISTGLKAIQSDDFSGAKHLKILNIQYNQIEMLPRAVLAEASELEEIDLSHNRITIIENFAFDGLSHLQFLYLSNNSVTALKANTFSGADNLIGLHIDNNLIETIENGAFNLPLLKGVFLAHNRIQTLSDGVFSGGNNLFGLDLSSNRLTNISQSIYNLPKLGALELNKNAMIEIDWMAVAKMPALSQLSLRNCGVTFKQLPDKNSQISLGSTVIFLDLSQNELSEPNILQRLTHFRSLEELNLNANFFSELSGLNEMRNYFPTLSSIGLSENRFKCSELRKIVDSLQSQRIAVQRPDDFDPLRKNYRGVDCS